MCRQYTQLGADHFLKYKWLRKRSDGHLVFIVCTYFPEVSKATDVFVRVGWKYEWFMYEAFNRNVRKPYHSRCHEQFQNSIGQLKFQKLWVGAVHSTRNISHLFCVDTWEVTSKGILGYLRICNCWRLSIRFCSNRCRPFLSLPSRC